IVFGARVSRSGRAIDFADVAATFGFFLAALFFFFGAAFFADAFLPAAFAFFAGAFFLPAAFFAAFTFLAGVFFAEPFFFGAAFFGAAFFFFAGFFVAIGALFANTAQADCQTAPRTNIISCRRRTSGRSWRTAYPSGTSAPA